MLLVCLFEYLKKFRMNEDFTFITQSSAGADDLFMAKSALQDSNANNSNNQILKLPSISAPI